MAVLGRAWLCGVLVISACGPRVVDAGDPDSTTRVDPDSGDERPGTTVVTTTSATTTNTSTTTTTTATTVVDEGTTTRSSAEGLDSVSFLDTFDDAGSVVIECDVWTQDCGDGEKCMPWANDAGNAWNATRCSPVDDRPQAPGDPCLAVGSAFSGFDDCALGALCWGVDPRSDAGTCYAQCTGSPADPQCPDGRTCWVGYEGTVALCLTPCDVFAPQCTSGESCVLDDGVELVRACIPEPLVAGLAYAEPCDDAVFPCGSGLACALAEHVPGCGDRCCTTLCDTSMPLECPDAAGGQSCTTLFAGGMPPVGLENLGACLVQP